MGEVFIPDSWPQQSGFLHFVRRIPPARPQDSWLGIPVAKLKRPLALGNGVVAGSGFKCSDQPSQSRAKSAFVAQRVARAITISFFSGVQRIHGV